MGCGNGENGAMKKAEKVVVVALTRLLLSDPGSCDANHANYDSSPKAHSAISTPSAQELHHAHSSAAQ